MPLRANPVVLPILDQIDTATSKTFAFGDVMEIDDKAFMYVKGITSGAAGAWVTYNRSTGVTALLAANAKGPVGIMMAALDAATKFGWIQVKGINAIASTDTIAADAPLYIDGTAGRADDAVVSGDLIANAFSVTADTTNVATVQIYYPFVTDTLS